MGNTILLSSCVTLFRRHLSLPLSASQFTAGDSLLHRLAANNVGEDKILAEAATVPPSPGSATTTASPTTKTPPPRLACGKVLCCASMLSTFCLTVALRQDLFTGSTPGLGIRGQNPKDCGNLEMHFSRDQLIGSTFIAFGITLFVCFFCVAIMSKPLPPYENRFLAAIQNDWYYCLLVLLMLSVIIVIVYLHWLSMKMFKHA